MVSDQHNMTRLDDHEFQRSIQIKRGLTPLIKGTNDAGSVDMEASSKNTTGKSSSLRATLADVMQVVQICYDPAFQTLHEKDGTDHISGRDVISQHLLMHRIQSRLDRHALLFYQHQSRLHAFSAPQSAYFPVLFHVCNLLLESCSSFLQ